MNIVVSDNSENKVAVLLIKNKLNLTHETVNSPLDKREVIVSILFNFYFTKVITLS